jgi:hypothetical protein
MAMNGNSLQSSNIFLFINFQIYRNIQVCPKGFFGRHKNLFIWINLNPQNKALYDAEYYLFWKVSIIDQSGEKKMTQYDTFRGVFLDDEIDLVSRKDLFDEKNQLLENGTLTLAFEFSPVQQCIFRSNERKAANKDNILAIYKQRKFTDLSLKLGDKSIKVHRVLLVACSSLLNDRIEKLPENSNELDLHDLGVEFEVAEQMVNFLYDEKVEVMEKYAKPLLAAADLLGMSHLMAYCEEYFFKKLSSENALETLKLSARYKTEFLRDECLELIEE